MQDSQDTFILGCVYQFKSHDVIIIVSVEEQKNKLLHREFMSVPRVYMVPVFYNTNS